MIYMTEVCNDGNYHTLDIYFFFRFFFFVAVVLRW